MFWIWLSLSCTWTRAPGPVPRDVATGPIETVTVPAAGPITWLEVTVRAGSAHDPIGKEGLSALTAELMRQGGAGGRSPSEVEDLLYTLGADIGVQVDREMIRFHARCLTEDLDEMADLMGDILLEPALDTDTLRRLQGEASEWLQRGLANNDERLGGAVFDDWVFSGHPYGHPTAGRGGVVETLTREDVEDFRAKRFIRAASVFGVAGGMLGEDGAIVADAPGASAVRGLQRRLTAGLAPMLYSDVTPRAVAPVAGRSLLVVEKDTAATGIHFGHPTRLRRDHPDWPAMVLAMTALGEHRQSHGRLYQSLRATRGLNYGDYAYIEVHRQAGWSSEQATASGRLQNPFLVWLRPVTVDNGPFALKAAVGMVEAFVEEGLTEAEFERMQAYLSGRIALWAADPGRRLGWSVEAALMGWPDPIESLPPRVAALTRDEVNQAIQKHIRPEDLKIVVVTGDGQGFIDRLGEVTPIVYSGSSPLPGSEQAMFDEAMAGRALELVSDQVVPTEELFR
ncbi:MAG: pitrilysin family protein [Myxococcota bacterium]